MLLHICGPVYRSPRKRRPMCMTYFIGSLAIAEYWNHWNSIAQDVKITTATNEARIRESMIQSNHTSPLPPSPNSWIFSPKWLALHSCTFVLCSVSGDRVGCACRKGGQYFASIVLMYQYHLFVVKRAETKLVVKQPASERQYKANITVFLVNFAWY